MVDGKIVLAHEVLKESGPFFCPDCSKGAILKKPKRKVDHFAHVAGSSCSMGGESLRHLEIKFLIYRHYKNLGYEAMLEHKIGARRCDVAIKINKSWIAIEIQLSPISSVELFERTKNHTESGYFTMWVTELDCPLDDIEQGVQYSVKAFQLDIHDDVHKDLLFQYFGDGKFSVIHLMGYRYKTFKHYKVLNKKFGLNEMIGHRHNDLLTVSIPEAHRWWERIKNNNEEDDFNLEEALAKSFSRIKGSF